MRKRPGVDISLEEGPGPNASLEDFILFYFILYRSYAFQAGLEILSLVSTSHVLGFQACASTAGSEVLFDRQISQKDRETFTFCSL